MSSSGNRNDANLRWRQSSSAVSQETDDEDDDVEDCCICMELLCARVLFKFNFITVLVSLSDSVILD